MGVGDTAEVSGNTHWAGRSWVLGGASSSSDPCIVSIGDGVQKDAALARRLRGTYVVRPLASMTRRLATSGVIGRRGLGGVGVRHRDEISMGDMVSADEHALGPQVYIHVPLYRKYL